MRMPESLEPLVNHGILDEVVRPLMSGKEALVYLVISEGRECVAKIYKDAQQRSFKNKAEYTEGRKVRNSRDQRAMSKRTSYGRKADEAAWKTTEVDMIYKLSDAGVRVPEPYWFVDGVLVMELVTDADGSPAMRLGELEFTPEDAVLIFEVLLADVVRMLHAGVVHGDLSEFNVLMSGDGPVIIDFPQAVNAAGNQNARKLLIRDVGNLHSFVSRFNRDWRSPPYAEEMWDIYERGELTPETKLTGTYVKAHKAARTSEVMDVIADARYDEDQRRRRMGGGPTRQGGREPAPQQRQGQAPQQGGQAQQRGGQAQQGNQGPRGPQGRDGQQARGNEQARNDQPQRDNRPPRGDQPQRDNRPPRGDQPQRDNRPPRGDQPQRDNRPPRGDQPQRDNRPPRGDQPQRDNRPPRNDQPQRDNRPPRGDQPQRDNRPPRNDQPQRDNRPPRGEQPPRGAPSFRGQEPRNQHPQRHGGPPPGQNGAGNSGPSRGEAPRSRTQHDTRQPPGPRGAPDNGHGGPGYHRDRRR